MSVSGKLQEGAVIVLVGLMERSDVRGPCGPRRSEVEAPPGEAGVAEAGCHQRISQQPGVSTIAIGKRVYGDNTVTQPHADFILSKHPVFNPVAGVVQQFSYFDSDLGGIDADIFVGCSILAGPAPDILKHPPMQLQSKLFGQNSFRRWARRHRPRDGLFHPELFELIKLTARGDRRDQESVFLVFVKRRLSGACVEI